MLVYIFSFILALAPALQAVFDLPLQLAFQHAVLAVCLAWLFLNASGPGLPAALLEKKLYPLWGAAALTFVSLAASPFRGYILNEWGNYAAGLLIFLFSAFLDEKERGRTDRAAAAGAWLIFGLCLAQAFVLKNFIALPPLTNLNALALYAVMIIPLALERKAWALAGAMVVLVVWTQSLGAVLAGLAAAGGYVYTRLKTREVRENGWLLAALAALAAAAFYLLQADSVAGRLAWWRSAWEMFEARPLAGFGQAAFSWAQAAFQGTGAFREHSIYAHNYYLEFLAENGLPAALLWFWALFGAARARPGLVKYSIVAALAHSVVDFGLSVPANFWLFCYLLASPAPAARLPSPGRKTVWAALALAALLYGAVLELNFKSLSFERAQVRAVSAARAGDAAGAAAALGPWLRTKLFRAPALELLGRADLAAGGAAAETRAAVSYEMALLENPYSARAWHSLKKIYSATGRETQAAGLERRRAEVYK